MIDYALVDASSVPMVSESAPATGGRARPVRQGVRRILPHAGVFVGYLLLTVVMTWPLGANPVHVLASWGDPVFQAWTLAWDVHAWRTDPTDIFNANIFYPYHLTLSYSDHLMAQAALVAPILLATGNAVLADNISVLLAFALSGFAMYLLVLDITGSRLAGIVAGVLYAFAPPRMSHLEHLHILSAQWLPLALLTARRALSERSVRWAAALGAVVLVQGLSGLYLFYFMVVMLAMVFVAYLIANRTRHALGAVVIAGAACVVASALLLPTLLPYLRVNQELGIERTQEEVTAWQAKPADYLAVSPGNRLWGETLGNRFSRHLEQELFPGAALLVLAVIGLIGRRYRWERRLLFSILLIAVVLSFGLSAPIAGREYPLPYRLLYDYLPGFRAIRVPARLVFLGLVGACGLAGLGMDALLRRLGSWRRLRSRRLAVPLTAALLVGLGMLESATVITLPHPLQVSLEEVQRPDYTWMAEHPAPAIELPLAEGIVASAWPNYWSTLHWNPLVNGYSGFTPPAYYAFRDAMRAFPSPETIDLLQGIGVRTVVYHTDRTREPADDPVLSRIDRFPELTQVVGGPDPVYSLAADPWMFDLAGRVPDGEPVDLPRVANDPATFGMLAAILQREGHTVYGAGAIDYWKLPPAPADVCFAVLPQGTQPDWAASPVTSGHGLALYERADCGP